MYEPIFNIPNTFILFSTSFVNSGGNFGGPKEGKFSWREAVLCKKTDLVDYELVEKS